MIPATESEKVHLLHSATEKFIRLNDDFDAVQAVTRRVFFEFLRSKPTLSTEEIEMLHSISELIAEIGAASRK
jgi:hypothetical protein